MMHVMYVGGEEDEDWREECTRLGWCIIWDVFLF